MKFRNFKNKWWILNIEFWMFVNFIISKFQNFKFQIIKTANFQNCQISNFHNFKFRICDFSNYTARRPFWSTKKTWCCDKTNFIWKIRGNPLPESCVWLFTTLCTGWILKKRTIKIVFAQHRQKPKIGEQIPLFAP